MPVHRKHSVLSAWCLGVGLASLGLPVAATTCVAESGPVRAALVELYTSEGCSSCPPADAQLSRLGRQTGANVVPLAWHVNFWDHIGWKDPYAKPEHTVRQRWLVGANGSSTLYTPHLFINGRELRDRERADAEIRTVIAQKSGAALRVESSQVSGGVLQWQVQAQATDSGPAQTDPLALHIVITENGLRTRVRAGENEGRTLAHDHVVRHASAPSPLRNGTARWQGDFPVAGPAPGSAGSRALELVAFVQNTRTGEVLQALRARPC